MHIPFQSLIRAMVEFYASFFADFMPLPVFCAEFFVDLLKGLCEEKASFHTVKTMQATANLP